MTELIVHSMEELEPVLERHAETCGGTVHQTVQVQGKAHAQGRFVCEKHCGFGYVADVWQDDRQPDIAYSTTWRSEP